MKKTFTCFTFYILFSFLLFAEGRISGKVFYNYTTNLDTSGILNSANGFNMKRAYLTFKNDVNETMSYQVTYDMGNNNNGSAHTAFLKIASATWKTRYGDISIGMQGMNMFKTMENTWGYRFIQKMPMDTYGFSPSADLGIGLTRKIGSISTKALLTNGGGYKRNENDKYKKVSLHIVYGEPKLNKKDGFNIGSSLSIEPHNIQSRNKDERLVTGVFTGFSSSRFRVGAEFDTKQERNNISSDAGAVVTSQIICAYGTYKISKNVSLLTRIDQINQNTSKILENLSRVNYDGTRVFIAGIQYIIDKSLIVAPTFRSTILKEGDTENKIVLNFQFVF